MDLEDQATRGCSMDDIAVGVDGAVGSAADDADSPVSGQHSLSSSDEYVLRCVTLHHVAHWTFRCVVHADVQVRMLGNAGHSSIRTRIGIGGVRYASTASNPSSLTDRTDQAEHTSSALCA